MQALTEDDEYARVMLDRPSNSDPSPRMAEWSPEVAQLAIIADRLGVIASMFASAHGGKASLPPVPRPRSAIDRVRHQRAVEQHNALVSRLLRDRNR